MKILVTGARGFIGKNLVATLNNIRLGLDKFFEISKDIEILECDIDTSDEQFDAFCAKCDVVFHLAGINRPKNADEFMTGNFGFTTILLEKLKKYGNRASILMSSSIQAELDNDYGKSKKAGEEYLRQYGVENGVKTYIFRLPNVFGKWCRPNYNSAVATFCNNIARSLPITVNNRDTMLTLVYIDDVVRGFINTLLGGSDKLAENGTSNNLGKLDSAKKFGEIESAYKFKKLDSADAQDERPKDDGSGEFCSIKIEHNATLGHIVDTLESFVQSRENRQCPHLAEGSFEKKLYSTYLSYLPIDGFGYDLKMNCDVRGSFTEFLKTPCFGQVSINMSKPHIVKGNHWHHTKCEKFLVVAGSGVIRFRQVGSDEISEVFVSGEKLQVVDIPTGYTHNIENVGECDMVTVMWANEQFDPNAPDTYFLEV